MAPEILRDPRVRSVEWRDLCAVSPARVLSELALPLPWLAASWVLADRELWLLALPCSFVFFLCGLRLVHNAFHRAVGLSARGHHAVMFASSAVMLGSMHAVCFNHLRHHRYCMADEDVEALSARMTWWRALLFGPRFPWLLHRTALLRGPRTVRGWVRAELATTLAVVAFVAWVPDCTWLRYHLAAMVLGQCLTAFFAVWTVHHDCDRSHHIARTVRGYARSVPTFNMFYHLEHHLFPAVPTCHLPRLAQRLDAAAPELQAKRVF